MEEVNKVVIICEYINKRYFFQSQSTILNFVEKIIVCSKIIKDIIKEITILESLSRIIYEK